MAALDEVLVQRMFAELRQTVSSVFDCFDDPGDGALHHPFAADRFKFFPTQLDWLVSDDHLNESHKVLRTQLLDEHFNFIGFLIEGKWKIVNELYTVNHPVHAKRRQERKRKMDEQLDASPTPVRMFPGLISISSSINSLIHIRWTTRLSQSPQTVQSHDFSAGNTE